MLNRNKTTYTSPEPVFVLRKVVSSKKREKIYWITKFRQTCSKSMMWNWKHNFITYFLMESNKKSIFKCAKLKAVTYNAKDSKKCGYGICGVCENKNFRPIHVMLVNILRLTTCERNRHNPGYWQVGETQQTFLCRRIEQGQRREICLLSHFEIYQELYNCW